MKRVSKTVLLFVFFALTAIQGSSEYEYYDYYAVYMKRETLEKSVSYSDEVREMKNIGKIYYKSPYIYVNEKYKGVHVINNSDSTKMVAKGFIVAPGCVDMAVKDNIIYLDNAVDMVSFDLDKKEVTERIKNVFPELAPPSGNVRYDSDRPEDFVIVEWVKR